MGYGKRSALAAALVAMACVLPLQSLADVRVLQLFSTPDGEYHAVLLEDDLSDTVDRFRGLTLVMHAIGGTSRSVTLTPDRVYENAVVVNGKRRFLVATRQLSFWLRTQAELPNAFLENDGGTLAIFGGMAQRYPPFAHDGAIAFEYGASAPPASNFALAQHPRPDARLESGADFFANPPTAPVVREYYHAGLDRYFLAVTQREKADLDAGHRPGWKWTGRSFRSLEDGAYGVVTVPVCRYYLPPPLGDTHFFSAFADECEAVARQWPGAILETAHAFRVALPERTTGLCMPQVSPDDHEASTVTVPIYRAWNGRADAIHRYTTSLAEQSEMLVRGWIAEGYGPHGTTMCVDAYDVAPIPVPKQPPKPPRVEDSR